MCVQRNSAGKAFQEQGLISSEEMRGKGNQQKNPRWSGASRACAMKRIKVPAGGGRKGQRRIKRKCDRQVLAVGQVEQIGVTVSWRRAQPRGKRVGKIAKEKKKRGGKPLKEPVRTRPSPSGKGISFGQGSDSPKSGKKTNGKRRDVLNE